MGTAYGVLSFSDVSQTVNQVGQRAVYEETTRVLDLYNQQLMEMLGLFVDQETEDREILYKASGGGYMQRRGGMAQSHAIKAIGEWKVGFPIEEWGDQVAAGRVPLAYMTAQEYDLHLQTVMNRDARTVKREILRAIFRNTSWTYNDIKAGATIIQPLANGDSVLYPPYPGSDTEATEDLYLVSNFAASAIDDTSNPYGLILPKFRRFGNQQGGTNLVVFNNSAQTPLIEDLTSFVEVVDRHINPSSDTAVPINLPGVPNSARVYGRVNGAWAVEWDDIPAGYMAAVHPDIPAPLYLRRDPRITGLPRGLTLVAEHLDYPIEQSHFEHRYGFGVANRLNGLILQLKASGTYDVPTIYQ